MKSIKQLERINDLNKAHLRSIDGIVSALLSAASYYTFELAGNAFFCFLAVLLFLYSAVTIGILTKRELLSSKMGISIIPITLISMAGIVLSLLLMNIGDIYDGAVFFTLFQYLFYMLLRIYSD